MNSRATSIRAVVASLLTIGLASNASAHNVTATETSEKCYGIAKAGQNDCGTGKHDCATLGKKDNDPEDWKMVANGTCKKLGGKNEPPKEGKRPA